MIIGFQINGWKGVLWIKAWVELGAIQKSRQHESAF
jgi:hypothetical protein